MDGTQYDLFLVLMSDYELRDHRLQVEAAHRLLRHQGGYAGDDYSNELAAIDAEFERRFVEARGGLD